MPVNLHRRGMLGLAAGAAAGIAVPAIGHPDAHLLVLGERLAAAWTEQKAVYARFGAAPSREEEAVCEYACDVALAIVEEIIAAPAATLDGLRVKARAIDWCYDGEDIDFGDLVEETVDCRLAASIVAILRVG
jgi:hypothetical protein